jgi:hypothetical protein
MTPAPAPAQWEPFQWSFGQLKRLSDGTPRPWYQSVPLWFAIFAVVWFAAYWRFW